MVKFLQYDLSLLTEPASWLSAKGKNPVRYFSEWAEPYPSFRRGLPGLDFDNLEKSTYFEYNNKGEDNIKWADCVINFAVHGNSRIAQLREQYPNKSIVGSGRGMKLENDRWFLRQEIIKAGLPSQRAHLVKGWTALLAHIKQYPDSWVKVNIFRGDTESFYVKNYEEMLKDPFFDKFKYDLGRHAEDYDFIVEGNVESPVEVGFDGFFNGIDYLGKFLYGYELEKTIQLERVVDNWEELPEKIRQTMEDFIPLLESLDYRGPLSTEEKITKDSHFFLDFTARLLLPGAMMYKYARNWPEFIYALGKKEYAELDIPYKYMASCPIYSPYAEDGPVLISIDKGFRDVVCLVSAYKYKDDYYAVPGEQMVAVVIGKGNTKDEALKDLAENAKHCHIRGKDDSGLKLADEVNEMVKKGMEFGIPF